MINVSGPMIKLAPWLFCLTAPLPAAFLGGAPRFELTVPPLRAISTEVTPPKWAAHHDWALPKYLWFSGGFAVRSTASDDQLGFEPMALLAEAYRRAGSVEAWEINQAIRISDRNRAWWSGRALRGAAVVEIATYHEETTLLDFFKLSAAALMEGQDDEMNVLPGTVPPNKEPIVDWGYFRPSFVVTFVGDVPAWLEFDFAQQLVFFWSAGRWGFYTLSSDAVALARSMMEKTERDALPEAQPTAVIPAIARGGESMSP